ncbi:MAG: TonB-dependent receptor [Candidatus Rokubacteria bacterium]|nr:TonB-dependent receptor [Candidatus Rokubacteria bacterium]
MILLPISRAPGRDAGRVCRIATLLALLVMPPGAAGQETAPLPPGPPLPTGVREEDRLSPAPLSVTVLDRAELAASRAATPAAALAQIPGLSLFGGTASLVADPPTQWVTLRGAGPGGTSRALVLLDGIPVNDPFGGWLAWGRLPALDVERVEAVRGPSPLVWGTGTTGGLLRLVTAAPDGHALAGRASYGDHGTAVLDVLAAGRWEPGEGRLDGGVADTDGFRVVRRDQRGPLDVPADGQARTVRQTLSYRLSADVATSLTGWYLAAEQGLGTPRQASSTEAGGASLGLRLGSLAAGQWDATVFAARHAFATTVTSPSPDRAAERLVLREEIPDDSAGAALQWTRRFLRESGLPGPHLFSAGADVRWVRGESRETSEDATGTLGRRRAGGHDVQVGVFAQDIDSIYSWLEVMMGARGAYWRSFGRADDAAVPDTGRRALADREALSFDQRTAVRVHVTDDLVLRASEAQGFRPPTLYEQFGTSRVRDDVTLPNARLDAERLVTLDAGADYRAPGGITLRGTAFWNELIDAVGALTLTGGSVRAGCPPGATCRQRQNLERSRVVGSEAEAEYVVASWWRLRASYLYQESRVVKAGGGRGLEGRDLAQVPRHQLTAGLRHNRPGWPALWAEVRYVGPRFEDDRNRVRLRGAVVVDVTAALRVARGAELFLAVENLLGGVTELARTTDGVVTTGAPTLVRAGLQVGF